MTGKRHGFHATWRVGFDDDGRFTALEATLTSDGGWSLDLSEPVLSRALCHVDNAYWIPDVRVQGRIAQTNKTSQTAFRGFGGPQGMLVIEDIIGRCAPLLGIEPDVLRRRNFYAEGEATPYGQLVRHPERHGARLGPGPRLERVRRPSARDRGVQRRAPARQAGPGDHAGEVRHLVQLHGVQPGRRAGARLQGRLGPDQPRRHRDGPGPAHQDAPGRGDRARAAAGEGPARADAHRQGAQHLGHRGQRRRRPQRRRGQGRLRPDPRPAAPGARRAPRRLVGRARPDRLPPAHPALGGRLLQDRGAELGRHDDDRARRSSTSRTAPPSPRSRSTASPAPTTCAASTSCTTSATASPRWSTSARSRAGSCRAPAG